jgi:hypothetical protein
VELADADADLSAVEDLGAEPAAVDEGAENGSCVPVGDFAGFTQPHAAAEDITDHQVVPDEGERAAVAGTEPENGPCRSIGATCGLIRLTLIGLVPRISPMRTAPSACAMVTYSVQWAG